MAVACGVALLWLSLACGALAFAGEYGPGAAMSHPDTWPASLVDLAKQPARVGGYFVNQDDYLAFQGDTARFRAFLEACAALPEFGPTTLHFHKGRGTFQPLDKEKKPLPCEWQLDVINQHWRSQDPNPEGPMYSLELHVWLEGAVDLKAIHIPASVKTVRD